MSKENLVKEKQDEHTTRYFEQLGFDIKKLLKKKLASITKEAQLPEIKLPEIEEEEKLSTGAPTEPPAGATPTGNVDLPDIDLSAIETKQDKDEDLVEDAEEIEELLDDAEMEARFDEIRGEFEREIKELKGELSELKDRKVPEAGEFDTGGVYKEKVFEVVTRVLDSAIIHLFDDIPDYSLIASQVSRTFEDGTISDALVTVGVTIPNEGYRYDFKIDVPILNGIVQYPTYIQRGLKIIPLTREKIMDELDSMAFRKIDVATPYEKDNIFNNIGDNITRRPDNQKWYDIHNTEPKPSAVPPMSKWDARMDKRRPTRYD